MQNLVILLLHREIYSNLLGYVDSTASPDHECPWAILFQAPIAKTTIIHLPSVWFPLSTSPSSYIIHIFPIFVLVSHTPFLIQWLVNAFLMSFQTSRGRTICICPYLHFLSFWESTTQGLSKISLHHATPTIQRMICAYLPLLLWLRRSEVIDSVL